LLFFQSLQQSYAQKTNHYKIVFEQSLSQETKVFLHKLSNSAEVIYDTVENSAIVSTATTVDKNILKGKLDKLKSPVKSIDLLDEIQNSNPAENSSTTPDLNEIQDKATKVKEQQLDNSNKKKPSEPHKRY
jgi:ATP-dependent Clp protease ATP-binding subunit ClpA